MSTYRGDTSACLQDYGGRFNIADGLGLMAEFTGVEPPTVWGWLGSAPPKGETLIKLRCFLTLLGYEVKEFIETPEPARRLAFLLALGVVSIDEVKGTLRYTNNQEILRVILRGSSMVPDRLHKLNRLLGDYQEQLAAATDAWMGRLESLSRSTESSVHPGDADQQADISGQPEFTSVALPDLTEWVTAAVLVNTLQSGATLAEQLVGDPELFQRVRELVVASLGTSRAGLLSEFLDNSA